MKGAPRSIRTGRRKHWTERTKCAKEARSERAADRREAAECSNGVLASAASEGSIDERSESIGERSEP
jgi:hypothetical protein